MEATIGANLKPREVSFRRTQNHPLNKVLKSLTAESQDAVDIIVGIMNDDKVDAKTRMAAAAKLLDMQRQVAADINQDELQRMLMGVKYGDFKPLSDEDDSDTPQIDFSVVQDV